VLNRLLKNSFPCFERHERKIIKNFPVRPERVEGLRIKLETVSRRAGNRPKRSTSDGTHEENLSLRSRDFNISFCSSRRRAAARESPCDRLSNRFLAFL
jgi:hypothetical protein